MVGLSFRTKVFLLFAGATLLTVVPAFVLISQAVEDRVYARATQDLVSASDALRKYWQVQDDALLETARRVALEPGVAQELQEADTAGVRRTVRREVVERLVVLVADSAGHSIVGPPLGALTLSEDSVPGSVVTVPPGTEAPIRLAVWPVWTDSGYVGVVGVGSRLDAVAVRDLKDVTGGPEVALVVGDSVVATTLPDSLAKVLSRLDLPTVVQRGGIWRRQVERLPYLYSVNALPARESPAAVLLFRPVAQELRLAQGIRSSLIGIGAVALLLALVLAVLVARAVAGPAQALASAATDLARGNYDAPLPPVSGDEIGQLARAFAEMRSAIAEREQRLRSAQAEMIHREKLAAMGRLVAQLSHEINNPIYNIQNCLEVLDRRGRPGDPNREFLELAREELGRMAVLTRQLLDQSRPQADAARSLDCNQLAQRVVLLAGPNLEARAIDVKLELEAGLPPVVAHADAIQQVLANLVENAVDAMPHGGTLRISTRSDADGVEVEVADTGPGIGAEHLPHIFDAFYTTKPGVRGVGLGLFVSDGIVRGHRGRLWAESHPGEGSRFVVRLPRETLDPAHAIPASAPGAPATV